MHTYLRLLSYLKPYWKKVIIIFLLTLGLAATSGASLGMIYPLFQGILTLKKDSEETITIKQFLEVSSNNISETNFLNKSEVSSFLSNSRKLFRKLPSNSAILLICITTLVLLVIKNAFTFLQSYSMVNLEQNLARDLRNKIFSHYQYLPLQYFATNKAGEIISRVTNDVNVVLAAVSGGFGSIIREGLLLIIYLVIVLTSSLELALLSFISLPVASVAIYFIGKKLRKKSERKQKAVAEVQSTLYENYLGIRIVKAFAMENFERERFNDKTTNEYNSNISMVKNNALTGPITEILGTIVALCVIFYGAYLINTAHTLSVGKFFLFLAALLSMMQPLKRLGEVNNQIQQGIAAGERFFAILDIRIEDPPIANPVAIPDKISSISFNDIFFCYNEDIPVLEGVSFVVKAGQILAIAGPSGAGKSTLVDLLPRFYYPDRGAIFINDIPINSFNLQELRKLIGIVTQETILFHDTIYNNLTYGSSEISMEKVILSSKAANAYDFIMALPKGFETVIGERGLLLSGGQKQRLAIARALVKDPPVLILDEATSALDSESEMLVQEAIERLIENRTTFVIAHRLSTIQHADLIIVLDKGRIIQRGSHEDLISQEGLYKDLYEIQFRGKKP